MKPGLLEDRSAKARGENSLSKDLELKTPLLIFALKWPDVALALSNPLLKGAKQAPMLLLGNRNLGILRRLPYHLQVDTIIPLGDRKDLSMQFLT